MSALVDVHYELHGRRGTSWTILEVHKKREPAITKAELLWKAKAYQGIRVLKETFDIETKAFTSLEILIRGRTQKPSKYDESGTISPCIAIEDIYGFDGRRSIWQLMSNTLMDWSITQTELLHHLEHYYKLFNAGTKLQNAVQRTAVAFEDDQDSIQERMRKIYRLIDTCVDRAKDLKEKIPSLEAGRLNPVVKNIKNEPARTFLLLSSISAYLAPAVNISDKFGRLIVLVSDKRADWVNDALDQILSEMILHPRIVRFLFDDPDDRSKILVGLSDLLYGSEPINDYTKAGEELRLLCEAVKGGLLKLTAQNLVQKLADEIGQAEALADSSLGDQLDTLNQLRERVETSETNLKGTDRVLDALSERAARLVNPQLVADLIHDIKNPFDKIDFLLVLESKCPGSGAKRTLANLVFPILVQPQYETQFLGLDGTATERLKQLTALQARIRSSDFPALPKRKITEYLDQFGRTILENTQLLKKLRELDSTPQDKARKILTMMADGYFTEGSSRQQAEQLARHYMKAPGFTDGLLNENSNRAEDNLIAFRDLLDRAGLKRIEATGLDETSQTDSSEQPQT